MRTPSIGSEKESNLGRHERQWSSDTARGSYSRKSSSGSRLSMDMTPVNGEGLPVYINGDMINSAGADDDDQEELVEVTLDVHDNSIVLRSVAPAAHEDAEAGMLAVDGLERRSSRNSSFSRSASSRLRQFSQEWKAEASSKVRKLSQDFMAELKRLSWNHSSASKALGQQINAGEDPVILDARAVRKQRAQLDRTRSGAQQALKGLRFISKTTGNNDGQELWKIVEAQFHLLAKDGLLSRSDFAQCIGMKDSKEFATEIFDALARRRHQKVDRITLDELYDFWLQISDQSFDSRLQIFFDMTHFARPNWKKVFSKIASKHPYATVGVFYCGAPVLAQELNKLSQEDLSSTKSTSSHLFHHSVNRDPD